LPQEPFTAQQVIDRCKALQQQPTFDNLHGKDGVLKNRHDLRHRLLPVRIPGVSELLEYRSPVLDVHANRYANRLDKADLVAQVSPRDPDHTKSAQNVENVLHEMYTDFKRVSEADREALDQQCAYMVGIRHLRWSPKVKEMLFGKELKTVGELLAALGQIVKDGFKENPFVIECPALTATYYEPNLDTVCEIGTRKISSLVDENPDTAFADHGWKILTSETMDEHETEWEDLANVYHLETPEFIYDVVEEAGTSSKAVMLEYLPNLVGRPWYTFAPGTTTSDTAAVEHWQPLIGPLYSVVEKLNITRTLSQSGALITGRPQWQEVADGKQPVDFMSYHQMPTNEKPTIRVDLTEEMVRQPRPGFHWAVFPVPDQDVIRATVAELQADIDQFGFPRAIAPDSPVEGSSGFHLAKQQESASDFLEPPLTHLARAWRNLFLLILDIMNELNVPMTIPVLRRAQGESARSMITLKPEDAKNIDLLIRFESIPEAVKFAKQEVNNSLFERNLISRQTIMANLFRDPKAEEERIDSDAVKEAAKAQALKIIVQFLEEVSPTIFGQVLAAAGIPVSGNGAQPRDVRPPVPFPGAGSPVVPPEQPPSSGEAPPSVGTEQIGEVQ
jgi:hypothetical protein